MHYSYPPSTSFFIFLLLLLRLIFSCLILLVETYAYQYEWLVTVREIVILTNTDIPDHGPRVDGYVITGLGAPHSSFISQCSSLVVISHLLLFCFAHHYYCLSFQALTLLSNRQPWIIQYETCLCNGLAP